MSVLHSALGRADMDIRRLKCLLARALCLPIALGVSGGWNVGGVTTCLGVGRLMLRRYPGRRVWRSPGELQTVEVGVEVFGPFRDPHQPPGMQNFRRLKFIRRPGLGCVGR